MPACAHARGFHSSATANCLSPSSPGAACSCGRGKPGWRIELPPQPCSRARGPTASACATVLAAPTCSSPLSAPAVLSGRTPAMLRRRGCGEKPHAPGSVRGLYAHRHVHASFMLPLCNGTVHRRRPVGGRLRCPSASGPTPLRGPTLSNGFFLRLRFRLNVFSGLVSSFSWRENLQALPGPGDSSSPPSARSSGTTPSTSPSPSQDRSAPRGPPGRQTAKNRSQDIIPENRRPARTIYIHILCALKKATPTPPPPPSPRRGAAGV